MKEVNIFSYEKDSDGWFTDIGKEINVMVDLSTLKTLIETADEIYPEGDVMGFGFDDVSDIDNYIAMYPGAEVVVNCTSTLEERDRVDAYRE